MVFDGFRSYSMDYGPVSGHPRLPATPGVVGHLLPLRMASLVGQRLYQDGWQIGHHGARWMRQLGCPRMVLNKEFLRKSSGKALTSSKQSGLSRQSEWTQWIL